MGSGGDFIWVDGLVAGRAAVASRWVNGEAETAAEAGKLVPVKIAQCKLPMPLRFGPFTMSCH